MGSDAEQWWSDQAGDSDVTMWPADSDSRGDGIDDERYGGSNEPFDPTDLGPEALLDPLNVLHSTCHSNGNAEDGRTTVATVAAVGDGGENVDDMAALAASGDLGRSAVEEQTITVMVASSHQHPIDEMSYDFATAANTVANR